MPGLEELLGLGGQVDPQVAQPQGSWTDIAAKAAADPVARSAMISAGLQMMTGGWGNRTQQLAQAMGAGAEGAAGTAKSLQAQALNIRDFEAKQAEGEANRASHEKIAKEGRASREEIANIQNEGRLAVAQERVAGMLERARMIRQPQSSQEMKIVSDAMNKYMTAQENQAILSKLTPEQRNEQARAYGLSVLETSRNATGVRSQGAPLPTEAPGEPPGLTTPKGPGAAAPTTTPGATAPKTEEPKGPTLDQLLKDPKAGPRAQEDLKTPQGVEGLKKRFPGMSREIDSYIRERDYAPHNLLKRLFVGDPAGASEGREGIK